MRIQALITICLLAGQFAWAEVDISKVQDLLDRNQPDLALEAAKAILAEEPDNEAAKALEQEATTRLQEAHDKARIEQLLAEADAYLDAGQPTKAQERLTALLTLSPGHAQATRMMEDIELNGEMDFLESEAEGRVVKEGDFINIDEVDVPPKVVKTAKAYYPRVARGMGIEGRARFLAFIGIDGKVEEVRPLQTITGFDEMNRSAEKAVRKYRFTPAEKNGVKVRTIVNLSVDFRL